jgi:nickel/cobalt transporter (NicO) family protein
VKKAVAGAALLCGALWASSRPASAHPAGFTSVNRYIGFECGPRGRLRAAYLLDFAELPSYTEFERLDADHDGTVSPDEQRAYLDARLPPLVAAWTVDVNGAPASLHVTGSSLEVREGERGMSTLRIAAEIAVDRAPGAETAGAQTAGAETAGANDRAELHVHARDPGFAERSGWREMAAADSADAVVTSGFKEPSSDALSYATGALANPPRVDQADFTFRLVEGAPAAAKAPWPGPPVVVDARIARVAAAMRRASGSWSFSAIALALAVLLGAGHALSPGHGKALAAAYLVGRRARPSHAFVFGGAVTAAHTAVVFLIGGLAVTIERTLGSDRLMRGLELASAVTVVVLGLAQLTRRWREAARGDHGHDHAPVDTSRGGMGSLAALGLSSGITPCPSALALLLTAVAIHRLVFGLVLVLAFSAGVAVTLTATGLLVVWARGLLDRLGTNAAIEPVFGPLLRWLPVLSSAVVAIVGVLLCASVWSPTP